MCCSITAHRSKKPRTAQDIPERPTTSLRGSDQRSADHEPGTRKNLLVIDSNGEFIQSFGLTKVYAYSYLSFSRLSKELSSDSSYKLADRACIILALGMDDWEKNMPHQDFLVWYAYILSQIRHANPDIHIVITSLLQRKCDFHSSFARDL